MLGFFLNSKVAGFLFAKPTSWGQYAFVAVRITIAAFWINSDIPRWVALAAGHHKRMALFGTYSVQAWWSL